MLSGWRNGAEAVARAVSELVAEADPAADEDWSPADSDEATCGDSRRQSLGMTPMPPKSSQPKIAKMMIFTRSIDTPNFLMRLPDER